MGARGDRSATRACDGPVSRAYRESRGPQAPTVASVGPRHCVPALYLRTCVFLVADVLTPELAHDENLLCRRPLIRSTSRTGPRPRSPQSCIPISASAPLAACQLHPAPDRLLTVDHPLVACRSTHDGRWNILIAETSSSERKRGTFRCQTTSLAVIDFRPPVITATPKHGRTIASKDPQGRSGTRQ